MPLIAVSIGYLAGSVPFALLAARHLRGIDIRRAGSGNIGAANILRTSGVRVALLVMALDAAKGAAAVIWAGRVAGTEAGAVAGLAAIVGHTYPVWLRFRGGKGVATAAGVFSVLTPGAFVTAAAVFLATVWLTRYISLGSVLASALLPPVAYGLGAPRASVLAAMAAGVLIVARHRSNLGRLRAGTERRIGQRAVL